MLRVLTFNVIFRVQPWVGSGFTPELCNTRRWSAMSEFSFNDLYAFLLTVLGMFLAYLGGKRDKRSKDNRDKTDK